MESKSSHNHRIADLSADFVVVHVDERSDTVADSSSLVAVDDAQVRLRLRLDLAPFGGVDKPDREPDAVVDVVAAAAPSPAVVAEAARHAGHVSGRLLARAAGVHVARAVGQVTDAACRRDGVHDPGRRHRVHERRLLRA